MKPIIGKTVAILAPAKVNLRLKVEGQRADGYHLLQMLNGCLNLCDEIKITFDQSAAIELETVVPDPILVASDPALFNLETNLASRALQSFKSRFAPTLGAKIRITKRIPLGAGLGGGSSDAGCLLRALGVIFDVPKQELQKIAIELGADVPFFLGGGFANVSGIGEEVEDLDPELIANLKCLLILPKHHVGTKSVFELYRKEKGTSSPFIAKASQAEVIAKIKAGQLSSLLENDLEKYACSLVPELSQIAAVVRQIQGGRVCMTGSGAAFFILPESGLDFGLGFEPKLRKALEKFNLSVVKSEFLPIPTAHVN